MMIMTGYWMLISVQKESRALSEDFDLDGCHDQLEDIDDDNDGIDDDNDPVASRPLIGFSSSATISILTVVKI